MVFLTPLWKGINPKFGRGGLMLFVCSYFNFTIQFRKNTEKLCALYAHALVVMSVKARLEENRKHIGKIIKEKRESKNITQQQLADILEINRSSLSRYEDGKIEIPASSLEIISDECGFSPIHYFHNKKNPYETLERIANNLGMVYNAEFLKNMANLTHSLDNNIYDCVKVNEDLDHVEWMSENFKDEQVINNGINLVLEDIVIECNETRNGASLVIIEKYCKELSRMISQKKDLSKDIV